MTTYNSELVDQMRAIGAEPLHSFDNDELLPLVVAGDESAIKRMIEGNMALVIHKVDAYIKQFPHVGYLQDDMISEGLVALVKAVNNMRTERPSELANPTGFISYWVQYGIGATIDKEAGVGACERTIRGKRAKGEPIPTQMPSEFMQGVDKVVDPTSMVDLRDLIDACCETDIDRTIVRMREEGYVDSEIAKAIDAPITTTYMRRREIYSRFLAKSGMKGEV